MWAPVRIGDFIEALDHHLVAFGLPPWGHAGSNRDE